MNEMKNNGKKNKMLRTKIEIKKIENIAARQVTFSKRRKGLFKKADELSTLCDADIAVIVFSSSGKLHDFSSPSSVSQVMQKYMRHIGKKNNDQQLDPAIFQPYLVEEECIILRKEVDKRTQELSHLQGDDLEGLSLEELRKLERQLEHGYARVSRMKDDKLQKMITDLKRKESTWVEKNKNLKTKINNGTVKEVDTSKKQLQQLPHNNSDQNNVSFDTSLKLGLS